MLIKAGILAEVAGRKRDRLCRYEGYLRVPESLSRSLRVDGCTDGMGLACRKGFPVFATQRFMAGNAIR